MNRQVASARMRWISGAAAGALLAFSAASAGAVELQSARHFEIGPQDLTQALKQYALQSGAQVLFSDTVGAGVRSTKLVGDYTAEEALSRLLSGSKFSYARLPSGVLWVYRTEKPVSRTDLLQRTLAVQVFANSVQAAPVTPVVAAPAAPVQEVVVTGSRLATGFATPTPVTAVDSTALQAASPNNIGESLGQLPSLLGSTQGTTSGSGSGNSQTNGQTLLNLRELGSQRTLVLMDGQRLGVTNVVGSTDVNLIPQNLVKRVDVVTGGASASYGSDAVAGVVNFILDTTFEGLKVEASGGETAYSDGQNGKISVAVGRHFGDRFRLVAAGEYYKQNGIHYGEVTGRDWFDHPTMSVANAAGASPKWLLIPDAHATLGTYGGMITAVSGCATGTAGAACNALANQQFLPGGALGAFNFGTNRYGNNAFDTGGDGAVVNQAFLPDSQRESLFLHGEFDANEHVTLWAQGGYNASLTDDKAQVLQVQTTSQFKIYPDNPYLPASVVSALAGSPNATFSVTRYFRDMDYNEVKGNDYVWRFAAGAKGKINDSWSYDADFGHQDTLQKLYIRTAISRNLYAAVDAVKNPNTGQIVCRSQFYNAAGVFVPGGTGEDPGCVPMNIFGDGSVTSAAENYVMGWNTADVRLIQDTVDMNVRGNFGERLSLGAGPISFATGASYRRLTANRVVDPLSNITKDGTGVRAFPSALQGSVGGYSYYDPSPLSGRVSVSEAYAELGIPLLKDRKFFQDLSATLAGRVTDYSQSGVQTTWKIGANWTVDDSIRIRGTVSSDIRAPTVLELFNTATVARGTYTLPYSTAPKTFTGSGQNVSVGNPNLAPEDARTYTAGVVLSPSFLPRFRASVDWYRINMLGQISAPGNQQILDNCYAGNQFYCGLIKVNGNSVTTTANITAADFTQVTAPLLNQPANLNVSGIDFELAYAFPLAGRQLTLHLNGNDLLQYSDPSNACAASSTGAVPVTDFVGAIGACGNHPALRFRLSGDYNVGPLGIHVQERYIDHAKRNPNYVTGIDISSNDIPAIWYTDLNLTWNLRSRFSRATEFYFNLTNLFDQAPPATNSTVGRSWVDPTQQTVYDMLGRRFVGGVRLRW